MEILVPPRVDRSNKRCNERKVGRRTRDEYFRDLVVRIRDETSIELEGATQLWAISE